MSRWLRAGLLPLGCLAAVFAGMASEAAAQSLPSEPISLGDGRMTVGGDVSASFGSVDTGFFNQTDYNHSAFRLLRIDLTTSIKANDHISVLGDLQTASFDSVIPYAFYVRIRPWLSRAFDIQAGRIPPTFGAFGRRVYVADNPLIGYPLAYQYLTTLRPDSLPATADELLLKRSSGWKVRYTLGDTSIDHGVPLVNPFRWDTGVQVHGSTETVSVTASITNGTVSNPLFIDDNSGKTVAGRVEWRPTVGLIAGTSIARGAFVSSDAARAATGSTRTNDMTQTAWGADLEYSRGYYLIRAETVVSAWRLPLVAAPVLDLPLRAVSTSVEGKYKLMPGVYAAARFSHLGFSDVTGTQGTEPWDAPVSRIEIGGGYSIQRNLLLKGSFQYDTRDGGRLKPTEHVVGTQVVFWF